MPNHNMMKLTKEDYESYQIQQEAQLKASSMNVEAIEVLLKWIEGKIKHAKPKERGKSSLQKRFKKRV